MRERNRGRGETEPAQPRLASRAGQRCPGEAYLGRRSGSIDAAEPYQEPRTRLNHVQLMQRHLCTH